MENLKVRHLPGGLQTIKTLGDSTPSGVNIMDVIQGWVATQLEGAEGSGKCATAHYRPVSDARPRMNRGV